jgi:1,4-alpha-glucan branching enzyme
MRRGWKVTDHIHSTSTEHWHPTEAGQECEWNHDRSLDWHLLGDPTHRDLQRLVRDLNALYRGVPALHELDCEREGFAWIDGRNASDSVLAYLRKGRRPTSTVLVVCNFTPVVRHHYRIGAPLGGRWIERINTDAAIYGGSNVGNKIPCGSPCRRWRHWCLCMRDGAESRDESRARADQFGLSLSAGRDP